MLTFIGLGTMIESPDIAKLVQGLRLQLALTQEEFAAKLGVTLLTVNLWENRCAEPSRRIMKLMMGLLLQARESTQDFPTDLVSTVCNDNGVAVINEDVDEFRKLSQTCYRGNSSAIKLRLLEESKLQMLERLRRKCNVPQELADCVIAELRLHLATEQ